MYLECVKCGEKYPLSTEVMNCKNHDQNYGYLIIKYDYDSIKEFPLKGKSPYKYLPLLPINEIKVDLGIEKTPLIHAKNFGKLINHNNLFVKDESKNPTGCFKDKENVVAINKAIESGIKSVSVVSSGNAALSTAAFAKVAKITCKCYIPDKTTQQKKDLITLFGGDIKEMPGSYEDVYNEIIKRNDDWNCTPGINPFKDEGDKIIAFEIWDEIGVPDKVIIPCGNGNNLAGIFKGFKELKILGKIDKLPQIVGVQIKGANPISTALKEGKDIAKLKEIPNSVAEGIVASESYASPKCVKAIKESQGFMIDVDDNEIKLALKEIISSESLMPEPTSATVFAAIKKIELKKDEKVVCVLTGSGMKFLDELIKLIK